VKGAVLPLELEEERLKLAEGPAFNRGGNFSDELDGA
jgi:hypothetical protein